MVKVLVVDDSRFELEVACGLLKGVDVVTAENGADALEVLESGDVDLVLTDMQMPVLDGLELVKQGTKKHPSIPFVLMTAHGSEQIAAEALRCGAASYVPKKYLAQYLPSTVDAMVEMARARRGEERAYSCLEMSEHRYRLDHEPANAQALMSALQRQAQRRELCDEGGLMQFTIALTEALSNALHHGNLEVPSDLREKSVGDYFDLIETRRGEEPYSKRSVFVTVRMTADEATYVIRDEGRGFDVSTVPDPTDAENLERPSGRGLMLIRTFMDEVRHNDTGNEITMVKRRAAASGSAQ